MSSISGNSNFFRGAITPQPKPLPLNIGPIFKQEMSNLLEKVKKFIKQHPFLTGIGVMGLMFEGYKIYKNPKVIFDSSECQIYLNNVTSRLVTVIGITVSIAQIKFGMKVLDPNYIDLEDPHRNLTRKSKEGKLLPMVGRQEIVQQIMAVLACSDKPNVLLVGLPGVGKTAIAEGLAQYLQELQSPHARFKNVEIIEVKSTEFLSGAAIVGQFEQRIEKFISDLENSPNVIVFIDEIHALTTVNTGAANARDILKPMLARGKARIIGCTTTQESELLTKDGAFNRRFQRIDVPEPSGDMLEEIIRARVQGYANAHDCTYPADALKRAIQSTRELPGHYPDKALAVLDQAGAMLDIQIQRQSSGSRIVTVEVIDHVVEQCRRGMDQPTPYSHMYI